MQRLSTMEQRRREWQTSEQQHLGRPNFQTTQSLRSAHPSPPPPPPPTMPPKSRASKSSAITSDASDSPGSADAAATSAPAATRSSRRRIGAPSVRSARVSPQSSARVGLISGLIEGTMVMMELMFGLSAVKFTCLTVYRTLNSLPVDQSPPQFNTFCIHITANFVVCTWLVYRLSQKHLPVINISEMADKLHLWPLPRSLAPSTISLLTKVFLLHFFGTLGMFLVQYTTGRWIFSWANYYPNAYDTNNDEGVENVNTEDDIGLDYTNGVDMILLAPIREELTFRALMYAIFYLRGAAFKVASPSTAAAVASGGDSSSSSPSNTTAVTSSSSESLAWTSSWKLDCIYASSITFGAIHLLNLFGNRYTRTYIILQVFLGMTLGAFYSMRFVLSENALLETILLHAINNLFSSFLPVKAELDLSDPLVSLPLLLTFIVYGTLCYQQYQKMKVEPSQPFKVLEAPPAVVAAIQQEEKKEH